eukprot:scaffold28118_cov70-Phaeocystis_antarctica.AAC.1
MYTVWAQAGTFPAKMRWSNRQFVASTSWPHAFACASVEASRPFTDLEVGTAITSRACAELTHHARASARTSPHGLSPSLYRPRPACSSDEAVTTTSIFSVPARPRARNSSGVSTVTSGWSVVSLPYSSV